MAAARGRGPRELASRKARLALLAAAAVIALAHPTTGCAQAVQLEIAGAQLHVALDGGQFQIGAQALIEWARRSATITALYYGAFPVPTLSLRIVAVDGAGVRGGRADASPSPEVRVTAGRDVSQAQLLQDWVLVHELTHLALPEVGGDHAWLSEGLATYVEGIARTQAGNLTAGELWQDYVRQMPRGLPANGDAGLDRTHTWARTYWGGALFCLVADVTMRERTDNRFGLQDALRAVARESGGMRSTWPLERVLRVGDAATGTVVLTELYASMRDKPTAPDLPALWRRLGIESVGEAVILLTGTREADIREAIMRPREPAAAPSGSASVRPESLRRRQ